MYILKGKNGTGKSSILECLFKKYPKCTLIYSNFSNLLTIIQQTLTIFNSEVVNLNSFLSQNNFKYKISNGILLFDKQEIQLSVMSPGEGIILYLLLKQYIIIRELEKVDSTVILLDEIDAHVHPSAIYQLIPILETLSKLGAQIIMTTHNPTTVSFIKPTNLYILERESDDPNDEKYKKLTMKSGSEKEVGKQYIVDQLTDRLVDITLPRKYLFVEGKDVPLYEIIMDKLKKLGIYPTKVICFIGATTKGKGFSNVKQVIEAVRKMNEINVNASGKNYS
jgi:predicted ATP-dependent endonuclease of OLD family